MTRFPRILAEGRRRHLVLVVLTALVQALAAACAAVATRDVFATFADPTGPLPMGALAVLVGSGLAIAAGRIGQATVAERVGQSFAGDVRQCLFRHLGHMPRMAVQAQRRGGLSLRFVGDLSAIRGWVGDALPKTIAAGFVLPAACAAGFLLDPWLGTALMTCVLVGLAALVLAGRRLRPVHRALRRQRARMSADMSERAPQAPDLRLTGRLDIESSRLDKNTLRLTEAAVARRRAGAVMRAIPDVIAALAATAVLGIALTQGLPASLAAGGLAATSILVAPLRDLAMIWDRYSAFSIARSKCLRVLARPTLPPTNGARPEGSLVFKSVTHGPLRELSVAARPGRILWVFGPNASGKSTLLRLAAGLEAPQSGEVRIGETPVAEARARADICLLDAHTPILAGSLRRALTLGARRRPDDKAVFEGAQVFGLQGLLDRLDGLDGHVAELGRNLSDGERWRVLLARANLTGAKFVLLDCPDRGLDESGLSLIRHHLVGQGRIVLAATDRSWIKETGDDVVSLPTRR